MIIKDRKEVEASKKLLTTQKPTVTRSGYISVVGEDGNVKLVEKPKGVHDTSEINLPFLGIGHKLDSMTEALTISSGLSTTTEAFRITVDPTLPQTQIKVRLYNGNMTTISVNHQTTVQQLAEHIKSLSSLPLGIEFNLKDQGSFPPRILSQLDQTIKQANLLNGSVLQSLVQK